MPTAYYNTGPSQTQVGTGVLAERQGLQNLLMMLQQQGRVDPRLMAQMQAANARSTQQQQDSVRGKAAAGGMARGGLAQALQASIGSAGTNRAANIQYQDIADSYGRNQQNLGLMNQLIQQPALGYSSLQQNRQQFNTEQNDKNEAAKMAFYGGLIKTFGSGAMAGCWVAEAIFGSEAYETHMSRFYVNNLAPNDLRDAYLRNGQELARIVSDDEALKTILRPEFMSFVRAAELVLG